MNPKFSIIIPTFNRGYIIERAIKSVLVQNYSDYELLVVDDGSHDDTATILQKYPQVKYIYQDNKGVSAARNVGASSALGEWLIFLDSDDTLESNCLEEFFKHISLNSDVIQAGFSIWNEDKTSIIRLPIDGQHIGNIPGSFIIRSSIFQEIGGYDEFLTYAENTELFHRISLHQLKIELLPVLVLNYNKGLEGGSRNIKNQNKALDYFIHKHYETLSIRTKFLYNRIIGVNFMKLWEFKVSRKYFYKAFLLKPMNLKNLVWLLISFFPIISKMFYPLYKGK